MPIPPKETKSKGVPSSSKHNKKDYASIMIRAKARRKARTEKREAYFNRRREARALAAV